MRVAIIMTAIIFSGMGQTLAGDISAGEKTFKQCKACHVAHEEKNKTGPHLLNVMGRPAGSLESYSRYSDAMKNSGLIWDEETLHQYLENPRKFLQGTKMAYRGLKRKEDRDNVIAYLKSFLD